MTIKTKTTAIKKQLTRLIDKNDQKQIQLVELLATQLSIYHHAKLDIEKSGLTIETKTTTKANPAINIAHNSCSQAMRLLAQLGHEEKDVDEIAKVMGDQ